MPDAVGIVCHPRIDIGGAPVMEARLITSVDEGSCYTTDLFETCLAPLKNALQPARFEF